ncbi:helix-turn-helix domain-containing protein [Clostridiisalibacter paucivorans]|uniref:helix-turn-helix domain-containing protein n=1 Tax=Clostridiisalibacter paucivorans TaxID=408753 RepID=UPI00047B069B|nr:helix-turn-helix transcriptional regulator [Clostridiisalibacter paucivorans]
MLNIKVLDILEKKERNIRWLSEKTNINYSTLYNFIYNKKSSVKFDTIDKLCNFFNCNIGDIIEHVKD